MYYAALNLKATSNKNISFDFNGTQQTEDVNIHKRKSSHFFKALKFIKKTLSQRVKALTHTPHATHRNHLKSQQSHKSPNLSPNSAVIVMSDDK